MENYTHYSKSKGITYVYYVTLPHQIVNHDKVKKNKQKRKSTQSGFGRVRGTATSWSWIFPESNFLYSGDPNRFNQFNCISRLAKPSFVLLIFWKCTTESSELGLKNILRRYYQKRTNRGGYLLPSLRRCSNE